MQEPVRRDRRILSTGRELPPLRLIRFVQADAEGEYNEDGWSQFSFRGNSIYQLRNEVANRVHINSFVMCVRAGLHAPLAPMLANLPSGRTGNTLYIVVIQSTTPGETLQSTCPPSSLLISYRKKYINYIMVVLNCYVHFI